ncbi:MAG: AAA family ATPase [Gammaproteobacteria bacterium]|nr:AAA family ATPase [Gammaproteobacteria bacterium]
MLSREEAFLWLHAAGAHLVLCGPDKRPVGKWRNNPASQEDAQRHAERGGIAGVVPSSLNCGVFDVDRGGKAAADSLAQVLGVPLARMDSLTQGREHLWYRAGDGLGKRPWGNRSVGGDLICAGGYVCLWHVESLVTQLASTLPESEPPSGPLAIALAPENARNDTLYREARADPLLASRRKRYVAAARVAGLEDSEIAATLDSAAASRTQSAVARVAVRWNNDSKAATPVEPEPLLEELAGMAYSEGLHVYGGWNGTGKSTFVHTVAAQAAHSGKRVVWFRTTEDIGYALRNQALGKPPVDSAVAASLSMVFDALESDTRVRDAEVVVFDPLRDLLTGDNDKSADVRQMLARLLAALEGKCVIGIHHLRKSQGHRAPFSERFIGSSEYTNVARLVLGFEKRQGGIVFGQVKNSLDECRGVWRSEFALRSGVVHRRSVGRDVERDIAIAGQPELQDDASDFDTWLDAHREDERDAQAHADALQVADEIRRHNGGRVVASDLVVTLKRRWNQRRAYAALAVAKNSQMLRYTRDQHTKAFIYEAV